MNIPCKNSGFSLVEILVGVAMGIIGVIVIFQVFSVAEGYRRTTTSGGDAQQNGALALFTIEREVRQAGYGINEVALLGCTVLGYDEGAVPARDFTFVLAPVVIAQGAGGAPDTVQVTYGNSPLLMAPAAITQNMPSPSAVYKVDNRYGFQAGDLIIAAESGKDCSLGQATGLPGTPGQTDNVIHNSGNYTNAQGVNLPARYNKPGGLGVSYTTNGKLFDIGPMPSVNVYSVQNGQLALEALTNESAFSPIVNGIVQLQARYIKDTDNDGAADTEDEITPLTAAQWQQVVAVRLAVAARSDLREKPDPATGTCNITTANPAWAGGVLDLSLTDADWQCYRYKVFQTVVPIRNMIWRP